MFYIDLPRFSVSDMEAMFYGAENFDQDINGWDVSKVSDINGMFDDCPINHIPDWYNP